MVFAPRLNGSFSRFECVIFVHFRLQHFHVFNLLFISWCYPIFSDMSIFNGCITTHDVPYVEKFHLSKFYRSYHFIHYLHAYLRTLCAVVVMFLFLNYALFFLAYFLISMHFIFFAETLKSVACSILIITSFKFHKMFSH